MAKILCIGYVCYDICFQMEEYPLEDKKYMIDTFVESGGGPAANAAYLLSSWGESCSFSGLIGDDNYGKSVISEFNQAGTELDFLEIRKNHSTPLSCIIASSETGSRTILNRRKSFEEMDSENMHLPDEEPEIILMDGHEYSASLKAMEKYRSARTVLDAGSLRKSTENLSAKADYLLCSERFALEFSGLENISEKHNRIKCLDILKKHNGRTVVVTMGSNGLIYNNGDEYFYLPACKFDTVDSSAAGDFFHGAFVYCMIHGYNLEDALAFSSFTAGLSTERPGTRSSLPKLAEVKSKYIKTSPELL